MALNQRSKRSVKKGIALNEEAIPFFTINFFSRFLL